MCITADFLLVNLNSLVGANIAVHCHILVNVDREAFIARDGDAYLKGARIHVLDDGIVAKRLWESLCPYGGGQCSHDGEAWVEGTVRYADGGELAIELLSCKVRRDDVEVLIRRD